jgi:hypothetical protein
MGIWRCLTQHQLLIAWSANVVSFAAGIVMTWVSTISARANARFDLEEKMQKREDRSAGQFLLQMSSILREYKTHPNSFSEDEMSSWLPVDQQLRLDATLHWLKTEGRIKRARESPYHWSFD